MLNRRNLLTLTAAAGGTLTECQCTCGQAA